MKLHTVTGTVGLELAPIGWQLFALGISLNDQAAGSNPAERAN